MGARAEQTTDIRRLNNGESSSHTCMSILASLQKDEHIEICRFWSFYFAVSSTWIGFSSAIATRACRQNCGANLQGCPRAVRCGRPSILINCQSSFQSSQQGGTSPSLPLRASNHNRCGRKRWPIDSAILTIFRFQRALVEIHSEPSAMLVK